MKQFKLPKEQIKPLAHGYGACFASDMITVEGHKVGYMYREDADFKEDGGWRFLSGYEDDAYMENPDNLGVYDVNTIANYDPDIIPFLDRPVGTRIARETPDSPLIPD